MALVQLSNQDKLQIPVSQEAFMSMPVSMRIKLMVVCLDLWVYRHLSYKDKDKYEGLVTMVGTTLFQVVFLLFMLWVLLPAMNPRCSSCTD